MEWFFFILSLYAEKALVLNSIAADVLSGACIKPDMTTITTLTH